MSKRHSTLCNCVHRRISFHERPESCRGQTLCTCACHSILTATISLWLSFFNTWWCICYWGRELSFSCKCRFIVQVKYGITSDPAGLSTYDICVLWLILWVSFNTLRRVKVTRYLSKHFTDVVSIFSDIMFSQALRVRSCSETSSLQATSGFALVLFVPVHARVSMVLTSFFSLWPELATRVAACFPHAIP